MLAIEGSARSLAHNISVRRLANLSPARLKSFNERGNARPAALIMKAG